MFFGPERFVASMRPIRCALMLSALLGAPAARADGWVVEPTRPGTAATVTRVLSADTFFGFTCSRGEWGMFFNYIPPNGGDCADHAACEDQLSHVDTLLLPDGGAARLMTFVLFENTYYSATEIKRDDMALILRASRLTVHFEAKLVGPWGIEDLNLPIDGLRDALDQNKKRFTCAR